MAEAGIERGETSGEGEWKGLKEGEGGWRCRCLTEKIRMARLFVLKGALI